MVQHIYTRALGITATVAVIVGSGLSLAPTGAAQAAPSSSDCPDAGAMPPVDNDGPSFVDSNVNVYAGGDFSVDEFAAETEGLLVVDGDAVFDRGDFTYGIGSVGVGSGISPAGGDVMVRVGGDLTIVDPTRVEVGAQVDGGGAVVVGGSLTGALETNGGSRTDGVGKSSALGDYEGHAAALGRDSARLAARTPTGDTAVSGGQVTFTGSNDAETQVFAISAAELDGAREFHFTGIPDGAPVVVTVTGGGTVSLESTYVSYNGERADAYGPTLGTAASRILWNLPAATAVNLDGGGQFIGSFLAPAADLTVSASTNGRLLAGGTIVMTGDGNENHAYPWIGGEGLECRPDDLGEEPGDGAETDTTADANAEAAANSTSDAASESGSKSDAASQGTSGSEAEAEAEADAGAGAGGASGTEPDAASQGASASESAADATAEAAAGSTSDAASAGASESGSESGADTAAEGTTASESDSGAGAQSGSEADAVSEVAADADSDVPGPRSDADTTASAAETDVGASTSAEQDVDASGDNGDEQDSNADGTDSASAAGVRAEAEADGTGVSDARADAAVDSASAEAGAAADTDANTAGSGGDNEQADAAGDRLPTTGASVGTGAAIGGGLIALGAGLVALVRRRRFVRTDR